MRDGKLLGGHGGSSKVVKADEMFVGGKAKDAHKGTPVPQKEAVVALNASFLS